MKVFVIAAGLAIGFVGVPSMALADGGFYLGVEGAYIDTDVESGGFNTLGPHNNTGDASDNATMLSVSIGLERLANLAPGISLRGELEGQRRFGADYVTNSFEPPVPTFFYASQVDSWAGFMNLWLDWEIQSHLSLYAGGGIGIAHHDVVTNDTFVAADDSSSDFAWQVGGGATVKLNGALDLTGGVRYVDLGQSDTPLLRGGPAGNLTFEHTSVDYRLGLKIKFGR